MPQAPAVGADASFIAAENRDSVRVAEKIGFRFRRQIAFRGGTTQLYEAPDAESG